MDMNYVKYAAAAVIGILLIFVLLPQRATVTVTDIKAANQKYTAPMVTAKLTNSGAAVEVAYWIEKDKTGKRYCEGRARLAGNETKALSFECQGLANHRGDFTLKTGPAG